MWVLPGAIYLNCKAKAHLLSGQASSIRIPDTGIIRQQSCSVNNCIPIKDYVRDTLRDQVARFQCGPCKHNGPHSRGARRRAIPTSLKKCYLPDKFMNSGQLGRYQRLFFTSIIATTTNKASFDSADRGTRRCPSGSL